MTDKPSVVVLVDLYLNELREEFLSTLSGDPLLFTSPEREYMWSSGDTEITGDIVVFGFDRVPMRYAEEFLVNLRNAVDKTQYSLFLLGTTFTHVMGIAVEWAGPRGAVCVVNTTGV